MPLLPTQHIRNFIGGQKSNARFVFSLLLLDLYDDRSTYYIPDASVCRYKWLSLDFFPTRRRATSPHPPLKSSKSCISRSLTLLMGGESMLFVKRAIFLAFFFCFLFSSPKRTCKLKRPRSSCHLFPLVTQS